MANVKVKKCKLFEETSAVHFKKNKAAAEKFVEFLLAKKADPMAPFGAKDYPFKGDGPLHGLKHAALANDLRIIYDIEGKDPRVILLYYVGTHDEMGTGQPPNIKRQKQTKTKIDNQQMYFSERRQS